MKFILKKADVGGDSGFIGNGKLTPFKNKNDSWILNQILNNQVSPGIKVKRDNGGNIKFANKVFEIANEIVYSFVYINKKYYVCEGEEESALKLEWIIATTDKLISYDDSIKYIDMLIKESEKDMKKTMVDEVSGDIYVDFERGLFCLIKKCIIPNEFLYNIEKNIEENGFKYNKE